MNYDHEILAVLTQAGEKGLKLEHIVRHVYNACNSMFTPLNYKDVYAYVSLYLVKSSKLQGSCVQKAGYGVYRGLILPRQRRSSSCCSLAVNLYRKRCRRRGLLTLRFLSLEMMIFRRIWHCSSRQCFFYLLNFSKFRSYHSLRSLEVIEVKSEQKKSMS